MSDHDDLTDLQERANEKYNGAEASVAGYAIQDIYGWGSELLAVLLSLEVRISNLENLLKNAVLTQALTASVTSDAFCGQETSQTVNSDISIQATVEQTVISDAQVE